MSKNQKQPIKPDSTIITKYYFKPTPIEQHFFDILFSMGDDRDSDQNSEKQKLKKSVIEMMEVFGFDPDFISWLKKMYEDPYEDYLDSLMEE